MALPGRRDTLKVLGLDPFRAAALQPALIGDIGDGLFALFEPRRHLFEQQRRARAQSAARRCAAGHVGSSPKALRVLGILSAGDVFPGARLDGHRLGAVDLRCESAGSIASICACARASTSSLSPRLGTDSAGRRSRHRPAGRTRSGRQRDPRLSGQSEHAGAGRTVDRRLPGVLDAIALGAAPTPVARAAAGAGRDAGPIAAGADRRGRGARASAGSISACMLGVGCRRRRYCSF